MADRPIRRNGAPPAPRRPQPRVPRRTSGRYSATAAAGMGRRPPRPGTGLPWAARAILALALVGLAASVILVGTGLLGSAVSGLGGALAGFVSQPGASGASGSPTPRPVLEPPRLVDPTNHYTNQPAWDVHGFVPAAVVGRSGYTVRIYVNGEIASQASIGATQDFAANAVPIPKGRSKITATVAGQGLESPQSGAISVVFYDTPPGLTITEPAPDAVINGTDVTVAGKTKTGATVSVRNGNTGIATNAIAADGTFSVAVELGNATNPLTITATDPAGNQRSVTITVVKGNGETTVTLHLSNARIRLADLPRQVSMGVKVLDPNGKAIDGATVNFGLSLPGLPTSTFDATTVDGSATWTTTVPKDGVVLGNALVTVLVTTPDGKEFKKASSFAIV